jgi:flagellar hook-length control protein FliK
VALRSVSTAPTPSASTGPAGASSGAASGIAALLGGGVPAPTTTAPAAAPGVATTGTNGPPAGAAFNFLQLLAQANINAAGVTAKPDPKAVVDTDAKPADSKSLAADENQDPNAIAAALALLSQYMSSPPTPAVNGGDATQASPPPTSSPASDAAASINAVAATGSAPTGKTSAPPATDAKAKTSSKDDSMPSALASLLSQDTDSEVAADPTRVPATSATSSDSTQGQSSNSDANSASSATAGPTFNAQAPVNPHVAAQPETHRADVKSPVGTSAWADELGGKITWMAKQGIDSASLRLSPEHLGPVEVHISVQDGATSVMFGASQADTRSALEQALPRLREMFANQGLSLADAGVSREPPRHQTKPLPVASVSGVSAVSDEGVSSVTTALPPVRLGLLDTYA